MIELALGCDHCPTRCLEYFPQKRLLVTNLSMQYQIGMLKKPTDTDDVVNSGFQETGISEGQIYGGIFLEDSADGCVSL